MSFEDRIKSLEQQVDMLNAAVADLIRFEELDFKNAKRLDDLEIAIKELKD